jgi:hypothetical protein
MGGLLIGWLGRGRIMVDFLDLNTILVYSIKYIKAIYNNRIYRYLETINQSIAQGQTHIICNRSYPVPAICIVEIHTVRTQREHRVFRESGQKPAHLCSLVRAVEEYDSWIFTLDYPMWDAIRSDPRFIELWPIPYETALIFIAV